MGPVAFLLSLVSVIYTLALNWQKESCVCLRVQTSNSVINKMRIYSVCTAWQRTNQSLAVVAQNKQAEAAGMQQW